jgi:hypothetical protein
VRSNVIVGNGAEVESVAKFSALFLDRMFDELISA